MVRTTACALVALLLATGCSTAREAGAAAVVDGERIPVSRLQDLTRNLTEAGGDIDPQTQQPLEPGAAQRKTLERLLSSQVLAEAARAEGVSVSAGDVEAQYQQFTELALQQLSEDEEGNALTGQESLERLLAQAGNIAPALARDYVRDQVLTGRLAEQLVPGENEDEQVAQQRQEALIELLQRTGEQMDIEVNPRYGTWDPNSGLVTAQVSGGLSSTLDELNASADAGDPSGSTEAP